MAEHDFAARNCNTSGQTRHDQIMYVLRRVLAISSLTLIYCRRVLLGWVMLDWSYAIGATLHNFSLLAITLICIITRIIWSLYPKHI